VSIIKYGGSGSSATWSSRAFPDAHVHSLSLAVTPLEILRLDGTLHAHGTAFIYRVAESLYLVTAWHVVSGRDFFSRKLNSDGLIPASFALYTPSFEQEGDILHIRSNRFSLELERAALDKLESPPQVFGAPVDLAVAKLPMSTTKSGSFSSKGLNEFQWGFPERTTPPLQSMIGADVFVLGYPLRTYEGLRTPIWKRGSLASEPSFQIDPLGAFLVDVNSAGGMSGGPIVRRVTILTADNKDAGVVQEFYDEAVIGIYSGRALSKDESSFVLGYGWPIDLVHEIIATGQCFSGDELPSELPTSDP